MDVYLWLDKMLKSPKKKALPILSFPVIQLMGIGVTELINDSDKQAEGMRLVAEKTDAAASVSMMDLSVEAECFGSNIRYSSDEVPTVVGGIVSSFTDAQKLVIPRVGSCRTGLYIDAIKKATKMIRDRPIFAGVIGPFSLAGRLMDVSEAMLYCYDDPDTVHCLLEKVTTFIIDYCKAYKAAGANGVCMAEPLAGLLSPALAEEFSSQYVKRIVDAVQDSEFIVIYHNCGDAVIQIIDSILSTGAAAYHFGNAIEMSLVLPLIPSDTLVMGNIDPAGLLCNGTAESVYTATRGLLEECSGYPNFVISSGCDIPPATKWENIEAFFAAVNDLYNQSEYICVCCNNASIEHPKRT